MSSRFSEQDLTKFSYTDRNKTLDFILELRSLLDKYGAQLHTDSCELYLNSNGYVGFIEDNAESIELVDESGKVLYTTQKT